MRGTREVIFLNVEEEDDVCLARGFVLSLSGVARS